MITAISLGLLILRVVSGLTLTAHGAQKFFGWFGGTGFKGLVAGQERMGFRPALLWATIIIIGELGGGLSLALGFLTPLGAAGMLGVMFMAVFKAHWKNGFFNGKRGIEFPLQLLTIAVVLGLVGAGSYSLDALFRIAYPQPLLFLILAVAALLVDLVGLAISRPRHAAIAPGEVKSRTS